jgi:hypothetical protein
MLLRALPLLLALALPAASGASPDGDGQVGGFIFHQRLVIRLSRRPPPPPPDAPAWVERHGPKCLPVSELVSASVVAPDQLDLTTGDGRHWRAELDEECPGLLFYEGFYVRPPRDGNICAGRDTIYSRAGAACPIRGFKQLVPAR